MENISINIVKQMVLNKIISSEHQDCYVYGLQLLFSNFLIFGFIFTLALLTGNIMIAVIFSLTFCSLRAIFGGYHCKLYKHCFIVSTSLFCILLLLTLLPVIAQIVCSISLLIIGTLTVIVNFILNKDKKHDVIGIILIVVCCTLSILGLFFNTSYSLSVSYAVFATSLLIIFDYVKIETPR